MKIVEKMSYKEKNLGTAEGVTIAFLGDSVTQGCFDLYKEINGNMNTYFDKRNGYERQVFDILCTLYPVCTVNIINAGISGDRAKKGLNRLERDVIRHQPDLCVVCYGLNDCSDSEDSLEKYITPLRGIFERLQSEGIEIIFMTPNMMNTTISPHLAHPDFAEVAEKKAALQNGGIFDRHIDAARSLCAEMGVPVCDCYAIWKMLSAGGVNTTELLSNRINHPTPEMHKVFAYELVKTMFEK